jgi:hypothetical protein
MLGVRESASTPLVPNDIADPVIGEFVARSTNSIRIGKLDVPNTSRNTSVGAGAYRLLAAVVNTTVVADENLTVGSTVWLPAESIAPGR